MPFYEHVLIARQDVSSAQVETMVEGFTSLIEENGGKVAKTEFWGLKTLAYRVKKNRKGHYVLLNLDAPPAAVLEYERILRLHEDVLRHLTLRVDELDTEPSIVMQGKRERDSRRDRPDSRHEGRSDGPREPRPQPAAAAATQPADATPVAAATPVASAEKAESTNE